MTKNLECLVSFSEKVDWPSNAFSAKRYQIYFALWQNNLMLSLFMKFNLKSLSIIFCCTEFGYYISNRFVYIDLFEHRYKSKNLVEIYKGEDRIQWNKFVMIWHTNQLILTLFSEFTYRTITNLFSHYGFYFRELNWKGRVLL